MEPYSENYRVVERSKQNLGPYDFGRFAIFEAHYGRNGELDAITQRPIEPADKTLEELRSLLHEFLQALEQPVLQYDDVDKFQCGAIPIKE